MAAQTYDKVAVLLGGSSAEREISLKSGSAVLAALVHSGINAHAFDPQESDLLSLKAQGFSHAFIALHGRGGEDGVTQGALETLQLPYTGSGVLGSALGMDKILCKQVWQSLNLPTAAYCIIEKGPFGESDALDLIKQLGCEPSQFDAIVKPANEGSSIGMARVKSAQELVDAVLDAFKFDGRVLLERWVSGREYTVAILDGKALPTIQMSTDHDFYDFDAKYNSDSTQYLCPCGLSQDEEQQVQALAQQAFNAVGCQSWGRVDFMRDEQSGEFYLLEVNTAPGMTEKSLVPMAAKASGLSFEQLVCKILALAKLG